MWTLRPVDFLISYSAFLICLIGKYLHETDSSLCKNRGRGAGFIVTSTLTRNVKENGVRSIWGLIIALSHNTVLQILN